MKLDECAAMSAAAPYGSCLSRAWPAPPHALCTRVLFVIEQWAANVLFLLLGTLVPMRYFQCYRRGLTELGKE